MTVCGLNLQQVESVVAHWQDRLRLNDWEVKVELVDPRTLSDSMAQAEYVADTMRATIKITIDHPTMLSLVDSIIHELCHLLIPFPEPGSAEMMVTEQAISRVAPVLAELYLETLGRSSRAFTKPCGKSSPSSAARKKASRRRSVSSTSTRRK